MKKTSVRVVIGLLLILFAFGSSYMPKKTGQAPEFQPIERVAEKISLNEGFAAIDYGVIALYALIIVGVALIVSRPKKGQERSEEDYFLAGKSLPWWAIGSSLIAANISAEQFVGMSGSGFAIGLAIATYEWMAALTLIIVGKYFLPIFIEKKIYTIPEFVEKRFNTTLKTILAVFWLGLYVFVNLATVMYLGALAMTTITGGALPLWAGLLILAFFSIAYSIWGGLAAVAWTDVIQVVVLVLAGIVTTILALNAVGGSVAGGFAEIVSAAPDHFAMILSRDHPEFHNLPGIGVLLGGMWVANLYYWGFNQYIIQRTFAAKSLQESQRGIVFAAVIKLIIPLIVVIPGIAAYVMYQKGMISMPLMDDGSVKNDAAYPTLLNLLPAGVKGIAFAGLIAAIVSSLASMLNSTATIFTMDIYKPYINKGASSRRLVNVGRLTAFVALIIAVPMSLIMSRAGQVFQVIQEYTGLVSPGILAIFLLGLFWKKATTKGAIWGAILSIVFALALKIPAKLGLIDLPFMHQMGLTCLFTMAVIAVVSFLELGKKDDPKGIEISAGMFKTDSVFNIVAYAICIILVGLYVIFWNSGMVTKVFGL